MQNGKAYQTLDGKTVEITGKDAQTVKDYLSLMKNLDALLKTQLDPDATDEKISELRKGLNQKYDAFVKNHGYLNSPQNMKFMNYMIKRLMMRFRRQIIMGMSYVFSMTE